MATSATTSKFRLPENTLKYIYDNFICDLCEKISNDYVDVLKQRLEAGIGADFSTARELFTCLENKGLVDCHNVIYIQQIIRVLKRQDLLELAERYMQKFREYDVLHFFEKSTKTASGFDIVEFHVVAQLSSRGDLEELRRNIAIILVVPLADVIIKGVQETGSFLIAVMIPCMYVAFLFDQLRRNTQHIIQSFMRLEVDAIIFSAVEFKLISEDSGFTANKGSVSTKVVPSEDKDTTTSPEIIGGKRNPMKKTSIPKPLSDCDTMQIVKKIPNRFTNGIYKDDSVQVKTESQPCEIKKIAKRKVLLESRDNELVKKIYVNN